MTTNDDTTLLVLNSLILAGRDAELGYEHAADRVKVPELVELFAGYSLQRGTFVQELEARVRQLRGTPATGGTSAGALHRGWMAVKETLESPTAHSLLAECERGEDQTVKAYVAALGQVDVDPDSRRLIQAHYEQVQAAHDRVRQLRDSATYAAR